MAPRPKMPLIGDLLTADGKFSDSFLRYLASIEDIQSDLSAWIDSVFGDDRGSVLVRGEAAWSLVTPSTSGHVLTYNGTDTVFAAAADPVNANALAKAWAGFSVTGTTVNFTAANNFNVASIARTGEGTFTVTFTAALPTANFEVTGGGLSESTTVGVIAYATSKTTAGFTLTTLQANSSAGLDPGNFAFVVHGL